MSLMSNNIEVRNVRRVVTKRFFKEETLISKGKENDIPSNVNVNKIPVSSESFETIIQKGMIYVDKTDLIADLLDVSSSVFICRPRKFGKSLVLDIMLHILEGSEYLFKGLKICNRKREWAKHAVFRFNFAQKAGDIIRNLMNGIKDVCTKHKVSFPNIHDYSLSTALNLLEQVMETIKTERGLPIAILIDEYDIPIVQFVEQDTEVEKIKQNSIMLATFFNEVSNNPKVSKFIVTGVAKFAKTSHFSAANYMTDVSFSELTSTLYGYTKEDLISYYNDYLKALAFKKGQSVIELLDDIMNYYNGYCFSFENSETRILNPFVINELLKEQSTEFKPYWIRQGRPKNFGDRPWADCIDIAYWRNTPVSESHFDKFEPISISSMNFIPETFLIQVGLLTLRKKETGYYLDLPNMEVKEAFLEALVNEQQNTIPVLEHAKLCRDYTNKNNIKSFIDQLKLFFRCLPNVTTWRIVKYEAYYQTCLYLLMSQMGYKVSCEYAENTGIIELFIEEDKFLWIIELKLGDNSFALKSLKEIEMKEYQLNTGKEIRRVAINLEETQNPFYSVNKIALVRSHSSIHLSESIVLNSGKPKSWLKEHVKLILLDKDVGVGLEDEYVQDCEISGFDFENVIDSLIEGNGNIERAVEELPFMNIRAAKAVVRWIKNNLLLINK